MTGWHVAVDDLRRWVGQSAVPELSASIEQHLLCCASCVDAVAGLVAEDSVRREELEHGWHRLRDQVQVGRRSWLERALSAVGVPSQDALLVASARAFRGPLLVGVLAVLVFAELASQFGSSRGVVFFLAVGPLLPTALVALSFDPDLEPALEQELATPYPPARLVLLRTIAVLGLATPVAVLLGVVIPGPLAWLWLLPAAGFVTAELAWSTWFSPLSGVAVIGAVWLGVVVLTARDSGVGAVVVWPHGSVYLALTLASSVVFALRAGHVRGPRVERSWR